MERRVLGKGLKALIPEEPVAKRGEQIETIRLDEILSSRFQPREVIDPEKQKELMLSIKEKGVIQPVVVRPRGNGYELIAGERRVRAAKELGFLQLPAIIMDVKDDEALEIALIENIQRQDLNPIEEAQAFQRLIDEFSLSQEDVSQKVGKDRASVANTLRLLRLPEKIKEEIHLGRISMGHAKAILMLESKETQLELCDRIVKRGLSVREAEFFVRHRATGASRRRFKKQDPSVQALEEELQKLLGTKVSIMHQKKRGRILIEYYSNEDLDRILDILRSRRR